MSEPAVTMHRIDNHRAAVRAEDVFPTGIDDLWSALTDPARLARWFAVVEGTPGLGATVHARFTSSWEGPCRIDVCEPPARLVVTGHPGEPEETRIEAVLSAIDPGHTRLVITESGLPADVAGYGAGWQAHVEDLAVYLAGGEPAAWQPRWEQLFPVYQTIAVE